MFQTEKQRRKADAMIEMEMADPDRIKICPVEILGGHAMGGIGAAIEQHRTARGLEPESSRSSFWVWN